MVVTRVLRVDHHPSCVINYAKLEMSDPRGLCNKNAKGLIRRKFSDSQVQEDMKLWPFRVIEGSHDTLEIVVSYKGQEQGFLVEEISAVILEKIKETAKSYLGQVVRDAMITVPSYFNDSQRQSTKYASTIVGLNIVRMINEPTTTAFAYGLENKSDINGKVKAIAGDAHLGGEDFVNNMVEHCAWEFKRKWNTDLRGNQREMGRLRSACEKAKRILLSVFQASIDLDCLHEGIRKTT
ncbi:putative heat shock protein 70 family protein [Tanacetum coccineum]